MTTLWLSGVSGFVASNVAKKVLSDTDWDIIAPVSMKHQGNQGRLKTLFDIDPSYASRVNVVRCDLSMPFEPELFGVAPDYAWHFAAESHVDRSITDPVDFSTNNFSSALHTLEYVRKVNPRQFFYFSTDEVYGSAEPGERHAEWSPIRPSNPYSGSKAASEAMVYSYWRTYNIPAVITNGMNIIGGSPRGLDQHSEKYLPKVAQFLKTGEEMTVHASASGESGGRYWINVSDVADAYLFLTGYLEGRTDLTYMPTLPPLPHRYNIVGEYASNLDLARRLAELTGRELNYRMEDAHSQRPGHDLFYALDGTKLANAGWTPPTSLDDTLREVAEMYGL